MRRFRTTPQELDGTPPGLPYIIVNEAAERFSYSGMKTILVVFMTTYLVDRTGALAPLSGAEAKGWYHAFASAVYFFPLLGSLLADAFLGKYRTIYWLSLVYCLGHLALAVDGTRLGIVLGLALIAVGSGGIKPCVSAHLGDQFGQRNQHRLERMFTWFYFAINIGSMLSMLATPWLLERFGPHVAFGVPGLLMLLSTVVFRAGRDVFVHVPPGGLAFLRQTFGREGLASVSALLLLYGFVAVFWALFAQTGSAWVLQAQRMDRVLLGVELLPAQVQAVQPMFTLALLPFSTYVLYPAMRRSFAPTPERRIGLGMALMALVFLLLAWIEAQLGAGATPSIAWHLLGYLMIALAEILVAVTCIELSYRRAPRHMKSFVMAVFAFSVSLGNLFTSAVNLFVVDEAGAPLLTGPTYFLFFAGLMALAVLLYVPFARWFAGRPAPALHR
ncbi:POT-type proton-dependent oligopeptide transporter [Nannocystis punicea]|uniref:MFS transporter n=1 Tax=Nannocystis punicea TaxID=2995304 RepID=A0ABY7GX81_9BACT|nr:MFS transporter [Nannocystis poenicansa]WAS91510.1 MFS transporter [Nannocystis poenicansa]